MGYCLLIHGRNRSGVGEVNTIYMGSRTISGYLDIYANNRVNLNRKYSVFLTPLNGILKKERPIFDFVLNQVVSALGGGSRP
ncbi:hypothetical protein HPE56_11070 [Maribacter sp. ANRC-HE7]|uniref:Uncharacterized protein n=1 Tax=Maribacter aquimaris TaxID=2737171 RepID=A0ABR7V3V0_9FLAO|nr:hypothetical protein [Maribacter aquimaris]MBD0778336.1 hypothetical protein [Maribacter aquimaris]